MFKVAVFIGLIGCCSAGIFSGAHVAQAVVRTEPLPLDTVPNYNFGYAVTDAISGDQKSASEARNGDSVSGSYSLTEPDGNVRTVTYTADGINGFRANVHNSLPRAQQAPAPRDLAQESLAAQRRAELAATPPAPAIQAVTYAAPVQAVQYAAAPVAVAKTFTYGGPVQISYNTPFVRYNAAW